MTAPALANYPTYRLRRTFNQTPGTGLVASFTPGKGWQASGFNLPIPPELGQVAEAK